MLTLCFTWSASDLFSFKPLHQKREKQQTQYSGMQIKTKLDSLHIHLKVEI